MRFLLLLLLIPVQVIFAQDVIKPTSNLIVEGIPPIPASIAENISRYSESRSAGFSDWHPVKKEMIISTRFGNVNQLHEVKMPLGARKQLTFYNEPVAGASYQPTHGNYFLFGKDVGGNEFSQIYRYDVKDGSTHLLTDGKRSQNGGITWSNSGKWIAYASTSRNGADRDIYIMDPMDKNSNRLLLENKGGGWGVADWSPNDEQLLVGEYLSVNESFFYLVNTKTGEKKEVWGSTERGISNRGGKFSRDGKGIYLLTDKDFEFVRLVYIDLATGKRTPITTSIKWDVSDIELSKDGKTLAFTTNEAGASKLYLMNTASRQFKKVDNIPTGVLGGLKFHNNNTDLALSINSAQSPTDAYVYSITTGKLQRWTESEMGGIVASQLRYPKLISWKSFDNREITGFYYPAAEKFSGKRPVIINIHGGPEAQSLPVFQGANNYYLNELGVAIIYPNVRGSTGYGKTFVALDNGMKREESVQDIGALLDWIAKQPDLDADRIMVTGGSYGGYMTLAVAMHYNDRIRCAVDIVGISHFGTFLKNTESYRRDLRRAEYGDERDPEMAAFFERTAPLNNADKIKKPMFIIQGGNDPRVPRTEAIQMKDKIKSNNGVVWYLEANDEGHGFRKKNNQDFQRYATILFINTYLLDGERKEM